jgi:hypothetical protein
MENHYDIDQCLLCYAIILIAIKILSFTIDLTVLAINSSRTYREISLKFLILI